MICSHCGKVNSGDSKFCKECGAAITAEAMPAFVPVSQPAVTGGAANPDAVRRLLEMAFWHSDNGNPQGALRACQAALALDADNISALSLLGSLYEQSGDIEHAIEAIERVVMLNPASTADAHKLELLQNGVRTAPVAPPAGYRWIPPALIEMSRTNPRTPMIAAACAAAVILLGGMAGVHALTATQPTPVAPVVSTPSADTGTTIGSTTAEQTASALQSPTADPALAPVDDSIKGKTAAQIAKIRKQQKAAKAAQDADQSSDDSPSLPPPPVNLRPQGGSAKTPSILSIRPIPLAPTGSAGTSPNPVVARTPAADPQYAIPEHTVVVAPPNDSQASASNGGPPPPLSHIEITFHNNAQTAPATDVPSSPTPARVAVTDTKRASQIQHDAFRQQQAGNYNAAISSYHQAIAAFNSNIKAGRDVDLSQRGIDSCETGIQICKQSQ